MVLVSEMGRAAHGRSSSRTARHQIANARASLFPVRIAMVSAVFEGAAADSVRVVDLVAWTLRSFAEGFANGAFGVVERSKGASSFY